MGGSGSEGCVGLRAGGGNVRILIKGSVVSTVITLAMVVTALAQGPKPSFSITISAPESVKVGSTVELDIVVKNIADHPIVFGSYGLTHNETNFTYDVRGSAGNVPSDTPYMNGPGPQFGKDTYSNLKPEETLKLSIDLCKMFELTPGKYTVQLSHFENAFALYGSGRREDSDLGPNHKIDPRPPVPVYEPSPNSNLEVKSNTITVTVGR
jgi:hypothetical protein